MSRTSSRLRIEVLAAALLLLVGTAIHASSPAHAASSSSLRFTAGFHWFDSGRVAEDIVSADLDGDGTQDLIVCHPSDDAVSVLLGAPGGGFRPRIGYDAGPDPRAAAPLDADLDGRVDVVVSNGAAGTLSILRGRGDGTLEPPRVIAAIANPAMVQARELDGDGVLDLMLLAGVDLGTVLFVRGHGDGTFDSPVAIRAGAGPVRMTAIDLPGRRRGLAVAAADGGVTIFASTPSERFRVVDEVRLPGGATAMCTTDIDGDGHADLVVVTTAASAAEDEAQSNVHVLRGTASGRFKVFAGPGADFIPQCITAVDVDGDGWSDFVAPDRRGGAVGVFRNVGGDSLHFAGRQSSRLAAHRVAVGDWNCDGRVDLAALEPGGRGAVLIAGQGDGRFGDAVDSPPVDFGPAGLWLGDLDGDRIEDLAATDVFTNHLTILRGDGVGGFAAQSDSGTYATGFAPERVLGARLRHDGPVDLVIAHSTYQGFLSFGRNRGNGKFTFAPDDTVHTGGRPSAFILGDVDGDSLPDAVVGNAGMSTVVVLWDSLGWFRHRTTLPIGGARPVALALDDLDGDGRADLVVATDVVVDTEHMHSIRVFHGAGGFKFTPGQEIRPGLRPLSIALADLDGDGNLDLVTGQGADYPSSGLVVVYRGDGHGAFGPYDPAWTTRVGWEPTRLLVLDLDGDGVLEIVTANRGSSTVTVVPGPGTRGFAFGKSLNLGTQAEAEALVAGDVDRDGRPDLLSAGRAAEQIGLLRNRTGDPETLRLGVTVDIAPGTCPNPLAATGGAVRAALMSGGAIDLADILPHTVRLEGVAALEAEPELHDESGPVDVCTVGCGCDGRVPDGVVDAVFTFDATALVAVLGTTREGESRELRFTANLRGGGRIDAVDCVVMATSQAGGAAAATPEQGLTGPNPLSPGGHITYSYEVPAGGADVRIGVFDVAGRRVASLIRSFEPAGAASVGWTPRDDAGRTLSPGVYFVRAQVGATRSAARIVLVP